MTRKPLFVSVSATLAIALISWFIWIYWPKARRPSLPPGPKPQPILGNIRDFPPKEGPQHEHWRKHIDLYGPVSSVSVLGKAIVLIHDRQAVHHILDKHSIQSSDRPSFEFASNLCGYGGLIPLQQYGHVFRRNRKLVHQQLGTQAAVARFDDIQQLGVHRLLVRILKQPEDIIEHLRLYAIFLLLYLNSN